VGIWGQPSFYSCLALHDDVGEASGEHHEASSDPSATPHLSPKMRLQLIGKSKDRWSPRSPTPVALRVSMLHHAHTGDDGYPSTSTSVGQASTLPVVLFSDEETTEALHLNCEPLQCVAATQKVGETFEVEAERSKWLDNQYRRFSKQVGVSIVGFESQCYSLLRRIDEERKKKKIGIGSTANTSVWEEAC
jgi:hypothetical protein